LRNHATLCFYRSRRMAKIKISGVRLQTLHFREDMICPLKDTLAVRLLKMAGGMVCVAQQSIRLLNALLGSEGNNTSGRMP